MDYDKKYILWAVAYLMSGISLSILMAASHNQMQHLSYAHILHVGFVLSLVYGVIHRLWLINLNPAIAQIQFYLHQSGAMTMFTGILLMYGEVFLDEQLEPLFAVASIAVLMGALTVLYMVMNERAIEP